MVYCLDYTLEIMVDVLKRNNLWNDTLIIFSSDNGPESWRGYGSAYPLRGSKRSLFEGGIRMPAWINGGYLPNFQKHTNYNQLMHIVGMFFCILYVCACFVKNEV